MQFRMRSPRCVVLDVEGVLYKTTVTTLSAVKGSRMANLLAGGDWKRQLDQVLTTYFHFCREISI